MSKIAEIRERWEKDMERRGGAGFANYVVGIAESRTVLGCMDEIIALARVVCDHYPGNIGVPALSKAITTTLKE
ncbi:MAG: hypothetical protein KAJ55_00080 [Anaerolineales bacterium]|nr:hypothetical protein [Anaerolineales bacterium]